MFCPFKMCPIALSCIQKPMGFSLLLPPLWCQTWTFFSLNRKAVKIKFSCMFRDEWRKCTQSVCLGMKSIKCSQTHEISAYQNIHTASHSAQIPMSENCMKFPMHVLSSYLISHSFVCISAILYLMKLHEIVHTMSDLICTKLSAYTDSLHSHLVTDLITFYCVRQYIFGKYLVIKIIWLFKKLPISL